MQKPNWNANVTDDVPLDTGQWTGIMLRIGNFRLMRMVSEKKGVQATLGKKGAIFEKILGVPRAHGEQIKYFFVTWRVGRPAGIFRRVCASLRDEEPWNVRILNLSKRRETNEM